MTVLDIEHESRELKPGTTGWSAADLDDPALECYWFGGRYEIIEGVLTVMAPAYFSGGEALDNLVYLVKRHLEGLGVYGGFSHEVDIIISSTRVVRADAVYLDSNAKKAQRSAVEDRKRRDPDRSRIYVPPSLVIESVSPGHEAHDRKTKRRWYAEFGVPRYWLLDVFEKSLECLILDGGSYRVDAAAQGNHGSVTPASFPGLDLRLEKIWPE